MILLIVSGGRYDRDNRQCDTQDDEGELSWT
jgi:hypothetical protein